MRKAGSVGSEEDAFGQELWSFYSGKETYQIVERDDGLFTVRNSKAYFSEFKDWPVIEQKAMDFVKGRVLDVGCGAGRHSLYLQDRGFDVVGIDNSPLAVKVSRLRGLKKTRLMPLEKLDFKPNTFDTVLMLGGNFGLFGNPKKAGRVLRRLHKLTSKDAVIAAETRDPYRTDDPVHLEYHRLNRRRGQLGGQTRIKVRFLKAATKWIEWMIVSKEEMAQMLVGTGWNSSQFIDSEDPGYIAIIKKLS